MATSSPTNPYESPRAASERRPDFSEKDATELAELRRRVEELERRLGRNWLVHRNHLLRLCGVWGYWLIGYARIVALAFATMALFWLVSGRPSV